MDWKIFFGTFGLIFLAELGDKTQLTALAFSADSKSTWSVFLGASGALVCSTFIAVLIGSVLNNQNLVPMSAIKLIAGVLFLFFGFLTIKEALFSKEKEEKPAEAASAEAPGILVKVALKSAVNFEKATEEFYLEMMKKVTDTQVKDLLEKIAAEERRHFEKLDNFDISFNEEVIEVKELQNVSVPDHAAAIDDDSKDILNKLLDHEKNMTAFYRELSERAVIPSLKTTFKQLAVEEENHAALMSQLIEKS